MRLNIWRVTAFFLLIALSVGFGFAFDAAATALEKQRYPLVAEYSDLIRQNAEEYGIPEAIIWATVRNGSGFASNAQSADKSKIGLMQLTSEQFSFVYQNIFQTAVPDTGMLYHPETNLQCGVALLSYLYEHYGVWDLVYAAYYAGTDTVDAWLTDPAYITEQGILKKIPDRATAEYVSDMEQAVKTYGKLYYEPKKGDA